MEIVKRLFLDEDGIAYEYRYGIRPNDCIGSSQTYPYKTERSARLEIERIEWKRANADNNLPIPPHLRKDNENG